MKKLGRLTLSLSGLALLVVIATIVLANLLEADSVVSLTANEMPASWKKAVDSVDESIQSAWEKAGAEPAPEADSLTLARRLSLALTGAPPSLEEIRLLEALPAEADPVQSWLDHLFADPRYHHYFAERLARAYVGVEVGPFLVYRRRRLVNWLADQLKENRPYDELVQDLISAEGIWTSNPEANFITVAVIQNGENRGPDEVKLAARTSRAFLGISLDCMQCHDDKFDDFWKQSDFHQLASFFAQSEMSLTGVRENKKQEYDYQYLGEKESVVVREAVPFLKELLPKQGNRRDRLARWLTHSENRVFARATTN
ncbi:MAG: DUF1549 domain-containing protein, partial [Verrucomicrobiota bacterium]